MPGNRGPGAEPSAQVLDSHRVTEDARIVCWERGEWLLVTPRKLSTRETRLNEVR